MPFFSIISPVYNTAAYLEKFLNSILSQSFTDYEVILIDDGSTDRSFEICKEYEQKDKRIKVFSQSNKGAGSARNSGIEKAISDYVLFFDSDDWINEDTLKILKTEIEKTPCDLLIFGSEEYVYDKLENEVGRKVDIPAAMDLVSVSDCRNAFCDLLFSSQINVPWNKVFKKSIIDEFCISFPNVRRAQDAFFNMEYYKHIQSLRTLQAPLYCYRSNTDAKIWKKFPKDLYKIDIKYDAYLVDIFKEFQIYDGVRREKVDTLFFNSILRTVGFYRNPIWHLSRREKRSYVKEIISDPYNKSRANDAIAIDKHTQAIRSIILSGDEKAMIGFFKKTEFRKKTYRLYEKTIRKLLKKNNR